MLASAASSSFTTCRGSGASVSTGGDYTGRDEAVQSLGEKGLGFLMGGGTAVDRTDVTASRTDRWKRPMALRAARGLPWDPNSDL